MPIVSPNTSEFAATTATTGAAPFMVTFQPVENRGFYPIADSWDYGDTGTASTTDEGDVPAYTISHTYTVPGTYSVTLTGIHQDGDPNPSTFTHTDYITVTAPTATATPSSGDAPLEVAFHGEVDTGEAYMSNITIVFDDATPNYTLAGGPGTTSFDTTHIYADAGIYNAVLTYNTDISPVTLITKNFEITLSEPTPAITGWAGVTLRNVRITPA